MIQKPDAIFVTSLQDDAIFVTSFQYDNKDSRMLCAVFLDATIRATCNYEM
jgi:hypothetical protein